MERRKYPQYDRGYERKYIRRNPIRRMRRPYKYIPFQIIGFLTVMYFMALLSIIIPLRPSYSDVEKRDLTEFPALSVGTLLDGTFFDDINIWFADTFPFRDAFISANTAIRSLYGFGSDVIVGSSNEQADEIPDTPAAASTEKATESSAEEAETTETAAATEATEEDEEEEDLPVETLGSLLIRGDSGYEYYNFVQASADSYVGTVNRCADALYGEAEVYDMIVPTSMDITVPKSVRDSINTSDQKKAIEYMYGSMSKKVKTLDVFDTLKSKNKEYIYFRTDHHWTALGAYYAYDIFMNEKGYKTASLEDDFTTVEFTDFLGSFYSDSNMNASLAKNPDTVIAYQPNDTNNMTFIDNYGTETDYHIITDVSIWSSSSKYNAFIGGDNPYSVMKNIKAKDGESILVVKESFGNAFVPFLVKNYRNVYVVDYRYLQNVKDETVISLARELEVEDVLFINNISATRNSSLMSYLDTCVGS